MTDANRPLPWLPDGFAVDEDLDALIGGSFAQDRTPEVARSIAERKTALEQGEPPPEIPELDDFLRDLDSDS